MRWLKYIFIGLTSLIIAAVAMLVTLVLLLDPNQLRDGLVHVVNRTSDSQLEINGPLEMDLSLSPSIKVSDIHFKNAAEDFEFSAANASLQIDLLSLRTKYIIVHEILISDAVVNYRQTPGDDEDEKDDDETMHLKVPFVERLDIENLLIHYWKPGDTVPLEIRLESLKKDDPAGAETIALTGAGTIDGIAFKLEGESGTAASLLASDQPFPLNYHFDVMQATIHAEGRINNPRKAADLDIALRIEAPETQDILELLHVSAPQIGRLSLTGRLSGSIDAPRLDDFEFNLSKDKVAVKVSGQVGNLLALEDINLDFSTAVSDAKLLAALRPDQFLRFDSLQSSGKFSGAAASLSLDDYTLDASGPGGYRLKVVGRTRFVKAHQPLRDLQATVAIALPDTEFIRQFTDAVPLIGPLSGTATLVMDFDTLMINDLKLAAGNKKTVYIEGQGDIGYISFTPAIDIAEMDLKLNVTGASSRLIGDLVSFSLPDAGPVKLSGRYSGAIAQSSIKGLQLQIGIPEQLLIVASGDIKLAALDSDQPLAGLQLDVDLDAPSTTLLTPIIGTGIPALGRIKGAAHISDTGGPTAITALDIKIDKGKDLQLALNGSLADLEKLDGFDMTLELSASDLNTIGQLFDQPLPKEGAIKYTGHIKGGVGNLRYNGRANLRNTTIGTELSASFAGKRPSVAGSIRIPDLDLHDIGIYPERLAAAADTSAPREFDQVASNQATETEDLFSKEPIDFSGLNAIDLDLEISINKLSSTAASITDVYGHVILENGKLDIKPMRYTFDNDVLNNHVTIDSTTKPPAVSFYAGGDDIDLGLLLAGSARKKSPIRGTMTARADLKSRGHSHAELAANLDGEINIVAENAMIEKSAMNLLTVDVIGWAISNLLSPNKDVNIDCAIMIMHFNKGIGTTDLHLIDTPDTLIKIDARLDLVKQTMDVAIVPEHKVRLFKTKKDPMEIYGPIANPQYKLVSVKDMAHEAGRAWLLAPLTISTSLLENITGLIVKPEEPKPGSCDKFLK